MPGSSTTPGRPSACVGALGHFAFRYTDSVGTRDKFSIAAQWLACTFPCRRFADILTEACARLGADVARSGRIEARTGLRMMPTSPRSPLSFRTAGFPQYGWKVGLSDRAFPIHRPT